VSGLAPGASFFWSKYIKCCDDNQYRETGRIMIFRPSWLIRLKKET